jgi:heme-degrading monooxygenase HmoA
MFANPPAAPYLAVIFTSQRSDTDEGYGEAAGLMLSLAAQQPGFLGVESARGEDGLGITVSYWRDEAAILAWRDHPRHQAIRQQGRERWYDAYRTRVVRVERDYGWARG